MKRDRSLSLDSSSAPEQRRKKGRNRGIRGTLGPQVELKDGKLVCETGRPVTPDDLFMWELKRFCGENRIFTTGTRDLLVARVKALLVVTGPSVPESASRKISANRFLQPLRSQR